MNQDTLRKIALLYVIPIIFLFYYLAVLFFNSDEPDYIFYQGLSGSELIIIGIIGVLELIVEIYFYRPDVHNEYKIKVLDRQFLYNLICLIFFLVFYVMLKFISTIELSEFNLEEGPSEKLKQVCYTSFTLGLAIIVLGLKSIYKLKKVL